MRAESTGAEMRASTGNDPATTPNAIPKVHAIRIATAISNTVMRKASKKVQPSLMAALTMRLGEAKMIGLRSPTRKAASQIARNSASIASRISRRRRPLMCAPPR